MTRLYACIVDKPEQEVLLSQELSITQKIQAIFTYMTAYNDQQIPFV